MQVKKRKFDWILKCDITEFKTDKKLNEKNLELHKKEYIKLREVYQKNKEKLKELEKAGAEKLEIEKANSRKRESWLKMRRKEMFLRDRLIDNKTKRKKYREDKKVLIKKLSKQNEEKYRKLLELSKRKESLITLVKEIYNLGKFEKDKANFKKKGYNLSLEKVIEIYFEDFINESYDLVTVLNFDFDKYDALLERKIQYQI